MHDVLRCLDRQIDKLARDERPDYDLIRAALEYFVDFADQCHHPKEDLVLARLGERDPVSAWIVGDLQRDHARLAESLKVFAAAVLAVLRDAELPRDAVARWASEFIEQQQRHMAMEQANFFPAAVRALRAQDWRELAAAAPHRTDPIRGNSAESRYDALRQAILAGDARDPSED